jgi:hypothetical protein
MDVGGFQILFDVDEHVAEEIETEKYRKWANYDTEGKPKPKWDAVIICFDADRPFNQELAKFYETIQKKWRGATWALVINKNSSSPKFSPMQARDFCENQFMSWLGQCTIRESRGEWKPVRGVEDAFRKVAAKRLEARRRGGPRQSE